MRDPYLFADNDVLKNKLGITNQELFEQAEADYVVYRLKEIVERLMQLVILILLVLYQMIMVT